MDDLKQKLIGYGAYVVFGLVALLIFYFLTGGKLPDFSTRRDAGVNPAVNPVTIKDIKDKDIDAKNLANFSAMKKLTIYQNGLVTPKSLVDSCRDQAKTVDCNQEIANITQIIRTSGQIKKAYLYAKVGVSRDGTPLGPLTQYDSLWFYITNDFEQVVIDKVVYGGHLLRSQAIVHRIADDGTLELLFDLSKLPVTALPYNDNNISKQEDVLKVLNQAGRHFTGGFVSTLGLGKIFDLEIGYEGGSIENLSSVKQ